MIEIKTPIDKKTVSHLKVGDTVLLSGAIYTARDAAHKRMVSIIMEGKNPPFPFDGNVVFYAGPCPAPPNKIIGSIGPTTSGRMDSYSPFLIERGLNLMIGKGQRNEKVKESIVKYNGIYFAAIGGAAALMAHCVKEVKVIAYEDLGTEAVRYLRVENFPLIVAIDSYGNDIYSKDKILLP